MRHALAKSRALPATAWVAALLALAVGCGNTSSRKPLPAASAGAGGAAEPIDESGGGGAGAGVTEEACEGTEVAMPKRIVRLAFTQLARSIISLTNEADGRLLLEPYELPNDEDRTFPPLASPREGSAYIDTNVSVVDDLATDLSKYAVEHVATFTPCGAEPSEACIRDFIADFAERGFRRPLSADEDESLTKVVDAVIATGDTPLEALRYGVQAVVFSPQFLYRTELGDDSSEAGPITPHELADSLAFFLTDAPPDDVLLEAARKGNLATAPQIEAQAKRLLAEPRTQQNLEAAMASYLGLQNVYSVVIDEPAFTAGVRGAMYREAQMFLTSTLWSSPLTGLLTSRRSGVNASLAAIYGIDFPPAGAKLDADGFTLLDLPENRAGILTQAAYLASRSRPDGPSVVARGLLVSGGLLCMQNPPFPEGLADGAIVANPGLSTATERQKAEFRATTAPCSGCHTLFDAYGLALDSFDSIGRFRTVDGQGRPIDPAVKLPDYVGGKQVGSVVAMAEALAESGRFESCMAQRFLDWSMAEHAWSAGVDESFALNGCASAAIRDAFLQTDRTFQDLMVQIAISPVFSQRAAGASAP